MKKYIYSLLFCLLLISNQNSLAQKTLRKVTTLKPKELLSDTILTNFKFRNIGPAFMSGRIADIAIHPENENIWYVAVGSGGVWKTSNAGTTFNPIFDTQPSYSIGCVTIDPSNPHTVWVGTGENIGGRHVGYGDGIYKSMDGGKSWKNMGLKSSEHISKIIIHPKNSDIIWVAAQGPLWNKGGERGLYKSTDGGKTWNKKLGGNEWTGVTDIVINSSEPDWLYAATWQRHRNVASYISGGPGSGIHRSTDGGETWQKMTKGLPQINMGKIGLAISPQKPDVIYAAIELYRRTGGVFRSNDRGSSWEKRSDAVSGATGPHYYQELYACPHNFDRIYLADYITQVSNDGGKSFNRLNSKHRHVDDHALAFKKNDKGYLLIGTDGGLYESFDHAQNWRFMPNLPVTQFYKVAVDDAEPFYNIYGGTQDNCTQGGPSRTDHFNGIINADWKILHDGDGQQPATEPGNPNIIYANSQEGYVSRIDISTGEIVNIQPQPEADETYERFNWDSPILVSPHSPTRIFFASHRLWQSDNRGDEWKAISGDLTKNQDRITLPIMEKTWGWDASWDFEAMSNYNTITSISESPKQEGLIYIGTDDGIIQVTENGGSTWRRIDVSELHNVPATAFVNDIKADLFDANTVYIALDNHKFGDLNPYLLKSTDRGTTWQSIKGNIPNRTLVWRIVQDHINPNLLFCATEFGIYFTIDGGSKWIKLNGGLPTISFRDLAIQKREDDLVGASFGRGFFVLDDYSPLREISEKQLEKEALLFPARKAWWYIPRPILSLWGSKKGTQGATHYMAPNPPFGATFTYYLKNSLKTQKQIRQEKERKLKNTNIPFSGWEKIESEVNESAPMIWLTISDNEGNTIRRIKGKTSKGFHRLTWDLKYPAPDVIQLKQKDPLAEWEPEGLMAAPGKYKATLSKQEKGNVTIISGPVDFEVVQLHEGSIKGASTEDVAKFWRLYEDIRRSNTAFRTDLKNLLNRINFIGEALLNSRIIPGVTDSQLVQLRQDLIRLESEYNGNKARRKIGEKTTPTINMQLFSVYLGIGNSTYGPTATHKRQMEIIEGKLEDFTNQLSILKNKMQEIENTLLKSGGPKIEEK